MPRADWTEFKIDDGALNEIDKSRELLRPIRDGGRMNTL